MGDRAGCLRQVAIHSIYQICRRRRTTVRATGPGSDLSVSILAPRSSLLSSLAITAGCSLPNVARSRFDARRASTPGRSSCGPFEGEAIEPLSVSPGVGGAAFFAPFPDPALLRSLSKSRLRCQVARLASTSSPAVVRSGLSARSFFMPSGPSSDDKTLIFSALDTGTFGA